MANQISRANIQKSILFKNHDKRGVCYFTHHQYNSEKDTYKQIKTLSTISMNTNKNHNSKPKDPN